MNKGAKVLNIDLLSKEFPLCKQIHDQIFLIENFISDDEKNELLGIATAASQEDWERDYLENNEEYQIDKNALWYDKALNIESNLRVDLQERLKKAIPENFKVKKFLTIQRHYPGSNLPEHIDKDHDEKMEYAAVLYLNEDYLGGELYFPDLDIELRLPEKSLILFYTGKPYLHGVKEILPGPIRYVIATFIWNKDD